MTYKNVSRTQKHSGSDYQSYQQKQGVNLLLGISQNRKRWEFQPSMSKKPKPKRRTQWTDEEKEKLRDLFDEFEGDVVRISKELNRGERAVRMRLYFMGMIREDEVN